MTDFSFAVVQYVGFWIGYTLDIVGFWLVMVCYCAECFYEIVGFAVENTGHVGKTCRSYMTSAVRCLFIVQNTSRVDRRSSLFLCL